MHREEQVAELVSLNMTGDLNEFTDEFIIRLSTLQFTNQLGFMNGLKYDQAAFYDPILIARVSRGVNFVWGLILMSY